MLWRFGVVCGCVNKKRPGMLCTRSWGPVTNGLQGRARAAVSEVLSSMFTPRISMLRCPFRSSSRRVTRPLMVVIVVSEEFASQWMFYFATHVFRWQSKLQWTARRRWHRLPNVLCVLQNLSLHGCSLLAQHLQQHNCYVSVRNVVLMHNLIIGLWMGG